MSLSGEYETPSSSRAAREFLAENPTAAKPVDMVGAVSVSPSDKQNGQQSESRRAERRLIAGRGKVWGNGVSERSGKLIDFSSTGASIWLDDQLPAKRQISFDCNVFHSGKHFIFQIDVITVYSSLTSGKGFKTGLQFIPKASAATSATIESLCKSLGC